MLKFWIITIVKQAGKGEATFVSNNKVYTDIADAKKDWDEMPVDSFERVELWECIGNKCVEYK